MKETFWDKHRCNGGLEDFEYESTDCNRTVRGFGSSEGTIYILEVKQKYSTDYIIFNKGSECVINGRNTGKKCWVSDISFSMPADMFGGITLVLKDGDYMTIRMDGKITSFMNIPFEDLEEGMSEKVKQAVANYTGDWRDFV